MDYLADGVKRNQLPLGARFGTRGPKNQSAGDFGPKCLFGELGAPSYHLRENKNDQLVVSWSFNIRFRNSKF
ncbi:hypothetical protein LSP04_23400 [Levilactobacillus spicheri]|uniref:Uncharacterized protein n=1 Tax=Levilactobacillus spicheri TaxID=216463 RepID=A0ABQ0WSC2_9LACO|nr:hypothetical protein LSP04_23400 [Levilactobacillus spicheri]